MKKKIFILPLVFLVGCAPPLEDECFSSQMDKWESANISDREGKSYRYISSENSDGVLDQQFYPDTKEGKTLFESHAWSKCTGN